MTVPRRLIGERAQRTYFIEPESIDYIEAQGNYVVMHAGNDSYIARNTIRYLTDALAPVGFVRIHRSLIVNFNRVRFAERLGRGVYSLTLASGAQLLSSAAYRSGILDEMRQGQPHPA